MANSGCYSPEQLSVPPRGFADMLLRSVLFTTALLCLWASFNFFPSLDKPLEVTEAGSIWNQVGYSTLLIVLGVWCLSHHTLRLRPFVQPIMIMALAWSALSVATSWDPSLSARRFVLALVTLGIAGMLLLVPKNLRHFANLMAAVALIVLVASYIGILLAPSLTIHQASDAIEPELGGDWRGLFGHKNEAGAAMVVFIYTGLLVRKVGSRGVGALIIALALPFLYLTHSKTALVELPLAFVVSLLVARARTPAVGIAIGLTVVGGLNILTIGSIYLAPIGALVDALVPDPTFSGRTDIWRFAIDQIAQAPFTGHGFATFWGTEQVVYAMTEYGWVTTASTAHNGYLDLALTIGIPGSILMTLWLVVRPLVDYYRAPDLPFSEPLKMFFLRVCLFAAYESCFESSFLEVGVFLLFLVFASFGLRFMTLLRVSA